MTDAVAPVLLADTAPFAQGGNRLCYVDPADRERCIKVRRPDFTLEDRRRKKGFPKNLLPLAHFDDNLEEHGVMMALHRTYGEPLYQHVSRCFGFVETDMGRGLASELIRDASGAVSETLKKLLWDEGITDDSRAAIERFVNFWLTLRVPSRDLLLHNIVAQRDPAGHIVRLVVIDGLGSQSLIPTSWMPSALQVRKAEKKIANFHQRIELLLSQRGQGEFPGYHGILLHHDQPDSKS
ncbi:YrbL family protein [Pontibacter sp. JAM-7]|uniref:YrbL family protein n=1 Tax=Pontibacter sp. JAM-7 TaxID=3366581 RepID=UPI003AF6DF5D